MFNFDILAATNNNNKAKEIKQILGNLFPNVLSLADIEEKVNPEETGKTFYENALIKAEAVITATNYKMAVLADDSGLVVPALNGEPGVMSARYAGNDASDKQNNKLLFNKMNNIVCRRAYFECVMVLIMPNGKKFCAEGKVEGEILKAPKGNGGFGYDPLFYSYDLGKSFGEADSEEKNQISHRARALIAMIEKLKQG